MTFSIYHSFKVAMGCALIMISLHVGPPRAYVFNNLTNFSMELLSLLLLLTGIWALGFFNKKRKEIMNKKVSKMKTIHLYAIMALVVYGILFPHYNHLGLIFSKVNENVNYFISLIILFISMALVGATSAETTSEINKNT